MSKKTSWSGELNLSYYKVIIMVSVIIINDEYPDLTTQLGSEVSWDKAGVYDVINTMIVGNEIAHKMKNEKDITEADIEANLHSYFGILIDELVDEVIERLINIEGCSYVKENNKTIINKTEKDKTKKLVNEIINNEEDYIIEYAGTETKNINNDEMKPIGNFSYMIKFFSTFLINEHETEYQGDFGHNGKYITDCATLIENTQRRAIELEEKYSNLGVKITIGDFNTGCQYGMAIYVWVPEQK